MIGDEQEELLIEGGLILIGLGVIGGVIVLGLVAGALYKAGAREKVNAVVTALSLLAVLSILGYAVGGEARAELVPVASLAVGALAAAMGQLGRSKNEKKDDEE